MSLATKTPVRKLSVLAFLAALGCSLLVACGAQREASSGAHSPTGIWRALPPAPIRVDAASTTVWTGRELIVAGVRGGSDGTLLDHGQVAAAYDPATNSWRRLPSPPPSEAYCRRSAVWTGVQMLVWGCRQTAFDPAAHRWRLLPQAPGGQGIVVWTGKEMLGWGGGCCGDAWAGGEAYDPGTNRWRTLAPSPLAPEQGPLGVWTGRELLLFVSGINPADGRPWPARLARAAAYDPESDTWRRIAPMPVHGLRFGGTAVWDGREVLVVGAGRRGRSTFAYDPAENQWRRLAPLPAARLDAAAAWTGRRLLVWGTGDRRSITSGAFAYDPSLDRWSPLPAAQVRGAGQVFWTGRRLLLWSDAGRFGGAVFTPARGGQVR